MNGRIAVISIALASLIVGGVVYYMQVYGYYYSLPADTDLEVTMMGSDRRVSISPEGFQGIDADSSPIRFRACFDSSMLPAAATQAYEAPEPLMAPSWFDCFDAGAIEAALAAGTARAELGQANIHWGVDRVLVFFDNGGGVAWNQINACGREVFEGRPAPADCPPQTESE